MRARRGTVIVLRTARVGRVSSPTCESRCGTFGAHGYESGRCHAFSAGVVDALRSTTSAWRRARARAPATTARCSAPFDGARDSRLAAPTRPTRLHCRSPTQTPRPRPRSSSATARPPARPHACGASSGASGCGRRAPPRPATSRVRSRAPTPSTRRAPRPTAPGPAARASTRPRWTSTSACSAHRRCRSRRPHRYSRAAAPSRDRWPPAPTPAGSAARPSRHEVITSGRAMSRSSAKLAR